MKNWTIHKSSIDKSVNFTLPFGDNHIETRYVRRNNDYFIVYLSSLNGCKHACRFCHLTSTNQTYSEPVDTDLYLEQAIRVFKHYDDVVDEQGPVKSVNFNWMAMGDCLSNKHFVDDTDSILACLSSLARSRGLSSKFNVSTIMPTDFKDSLLIDFKGLPVDFYYSLYSMNPVFRKRWIPKSKPVEQSLKMLSEWQKSQHREVVLHWAFIKDENDSEQDVNDICDAVLKHDLKVRVNVVRYNPPNDKSSESSEDIINRNFEIIRNRLSMESKIVPKVGMDIMASCGTFFT